MLLDKEGWDEVDVATSIVFRTHRDESWFVFMRNGYGSEYQAGVVVKVNPPRDSPGNDFVGEGDDVCGGSLTDGEWGSSRHSRLPILAVLVARVVPHIPKLIHDVKCGVVCRDCSGC